MSIPWPGFSHHHIAQVTSTLAAFLSPLALTVLAKTTSSIVRHLFHTSGQNHQSCDLFPIHSLRSREETASEADLKESLPRETCQSLEQCADIPQTVFVPCEYCTCYFSDSEEGGDSPRVYQMEFLGSQRPVGDQVRAGSINNHTRSSRGTPQALGRHNGQSRDTNCSAELSNNPTKLCTIERIGDDSVSSKDKQGILLSAHMQGSDKLACDMGEQETLVLDEHQLQEKTFPEKEIACENVRPVPTSELGNLETQKVRPDKKLDRDSTTVSCEENATNGERCQRKPGLENVPEQDVKEADSTRQRKWNSVDDAVGREGMEVPPVEMPETEAKDADRSEKRSRAGEKRGLKDGSAEEEPKPDSQKRAKSGEAREKSPKITQKGRGENPPMPSKILSRSSSCESFSTACDSSASSSAYPTDSEQDERPIPKSENHNKRQSVDRRIKDSRKRHNSRGAPSDNQPSSSPIFEYATPPFLALSDHQDNNSKHSYCKTDRMYDDDDDDRLSKEPNTERKSSFGEWLKSILKALLPFSGQKDSGSYHSNNTFHEYDIRNISNAHAVELWGSCEPCFEGDQTHPHSCASSLCNFRLTLESWKKELVAMEDALEASSQTSGASPCSFCHRDRYCQGLTSCKTMQLAQKFWSTIVELKQTHLRSCDCPRLNRRISEKSNTGTSRDDSKQRSAEPLHLCRNDFSGCSQRRYGSLAGVGLEAPCVHVLLYELDLLQKKLQTLTQSRIGTKSQGSETSNVTDQMHAHNEKAKQHQDHGPYSFDEAKLNMISQQCREGSDLASAQKNFPYSIPSATAAENAVPVRFDSLTRSQQLAQTTSSQPLEHGSGSQSKEKSNISMLSHSPGWSATEELGELEELTDFFLGKGEQHTSRQSNGNLKDYQNITPEYRGSLTGFEATYKSALQKPCDVLSHTNSLPQLMPQRNPQMLDSDTPKAFKRQSEQENELTNMQVLNKTRSLGIFAEQYLGYIENTLDNRMITPNTLAASSVAPACGGDSSKTRVNINRVDSIPQSNSFRMYQASQCTTDVHNKNQPADESFIRMLTDETTPAELGSITKEHSHDAITKAKRMGSFTEEQKNSNLKSAFDSIIADLIQFQQNQCKHKQDKLVDAPLDKSSKNVKFSPSSTQKTDSMTNVSSLGDTSPPLHCAVPSNSSSSIDNCLKDLTVTEAFDQLDKIVDELLNLMDNKLEPCME